MTSPLFVWDYRFDLVLNWIMFIWLYVFMFYYSLMPFVISAKHDGSASQLNFNMANMDWFSCCEASLDVIKWLTHLEVVDGVGRGKPGGARVLLGTEGPVEGLGDGAQVEGTHRRCRNTIAL